MQELPTIDAILSQICGITLILQKRFIKLFYSLFLWWMPPGSFRTLVKFKEKENYNMFELRQFFWRIFVHISFWFSVNIKRDCLGLSMECWKLSFKNENIWTFLANLHLNLLPPLATSIEIWCARNFGSATHL